MPRVSFSVPHQLGQEAALQRLKDKTEVVKRSFAGEVSNASDRWEGNQLEFGFTTAGMNVKGTMVVGEADVQVNVDLPLVAMMFKGMVERRVRDELGKVLG